MFFFFKQKTAYEMRISDWSSDVCSSDLREQIGLWYGQIEPLHHLPAMYDRAVPLLMLSDFGICGHGNDAVADRPFTHRGLPNGREQEVIHALARDAIPLTADPTSEFRGLIHTQLPRENGPV